ncbi:lipase 3 [Folsomia candida]|uniref:lipase 3 n=1 Tax=Folsomia candida TaxID=158441 RepID=UPI000B8F25A8|nr:lipase 3 [Folsomia candida]
MRQSLAIGLTILSTFLVANATQNFVFPSDQAGQEKLWNDTIQAILKFKEEFESRSPADVLQAEDGDASLTVPEVILRYGYPVEVHNITTEDGYIIQAHRIPYGLACGAVNEGSPKKRVVWMQHGLMGDSSNWVITGNKSRGLGFALADGCYDVWMGNYRGNTYSTMHTTLLPSQPEFWDFSWHDLGMYDIPAGIDYVLNHTQAESLYYIGHSMGTTGFFVTMSERPEYNAKVKLMSALAPALFMSHSTSVITRLLVELFVPIIDQVPYVEAFPIEWTKDLAAELCKRGAPTQPLCSIILYLIGGKNEPQLDLDSLPAILGHSPAGSSTKTFMHYGQGIVSGQFEKFNYRGANPDKYNGSLTPPKYDLGKITTPIAIYYGDNDFLADPQDVLRGAREFSTLVNLHRVNDTLFSHLDFVWALDQGTLINKPVMDFMEEFANRLPPNGVAGRVQFMNGLLSMTVILVINKML